jgi:putative hydrolase of the HAD superfamily
MLGDLGVPATAERLRRAEVEGRRGYDRAAQARDSLPTAGAEPSIPPIDAYWRDMLAATGCPPSRLDEAVRRLRARQDSDHFLWAKPMEGAREAIDGVAALGLRRACVSNSDGRAERHLERFGVRAGLEFVVDSAVVGIEKPDPRIFALALARLDVAPERALYVGDIRSVDEHGARAAGMRFVLLDPFGDYGAPDGPCIASIRDLPAWLAGAFATPAGEERRRS